MTRGEVYGIRWSTSLPSLSLLGLGQFALQGRRDRVKSTHNCVSIAGIVLKKSHLRKADGTSGVV